MRGLIAALALFAAFVLFHEALADSQSLSSASSSDVQMSLDGGATWVDCIPSEAHPSLPRAADVMFRLRSSKSFVSLPSCAAVEGPAAIAWRGLDAIGVRSDVICHGGRYAFVKLNAHPAPIIPSWHYFLHEPESEIGSGAVSGKTSGDKEKKKQKGFWSNYGIYIAAFVAVSLLQGIREGNAQYQQQHDEENRLEEARRAGATAKTNIVVPRRKSGKGRKSSAKKA